VNYAKHTPPIEPIAPEHQTLLDRVQHLRREQEIIDSLLHKRETTDAEPEIVEYIAFLVSSCRVPMTDRPGIDGDATAARMADAVFRDCRAHVWEAGVVVGKWLSEAALAAVREHGKETHVGVWEQSGPQLLDLYVFLP
jgi:hypothetical protein